jgi:4-amino-4-deoxy-L-arabinose transferase-like glycosyltransferase
VTGSPVWPLVLGASGKVFGLRASATALPELLYFVDLALLYFLAMALWKGIAGERAGWLFRSGRVPDFGHLAVFVLATNVVFFRFSSVPNNDALAFTFLFCALIAVGQAALRGSAAIAGFAGIFASLALLTRVQTLGVVVTIPAVLFWVGLGQGRALRLLSASLLGIALCMIPWITYLLSWHDALAFGHVLGL